MDKTLDEINRRIREGNARVVTAEEMPAIVSELGEEGALAEVDVVTTGTFGAMCSSGPFSTSAMPTLPYAWSGSG